MFSLKRIRSLLQKKIVWCVWIFWFHMLLSLLYYIHEKKCCWIRCTIITIYYNKMFVQDIFWNTITLVYYTWHDISSGNSIEFAFFRWHSNVSPNFVCKFNWISLEVQLNFHANSIEFAYISGEIQLNFPFEHIFTGFSNNLLTHKVKSAPNLRRCVAYILYIAIMHAVKFSVQSLLWWSKSSL